VEDQGKKQVICCANIFILRFNAARLLNFLKDYPNNCVLRTVVTIITGNAQMRTINFSHHERTNRTQNGDRGIGACPQQPIVQPAADDEGAARSAQSGEDFVFLVKFADGDSSQWLDSRSGKENL
jgi:hypothetical protein